MVATTGIQSSEARVFAVFNTPSEGEEVSQVRVLSPTISDTALMDVSEIRVMAVVHGRQDNRRMRSGWFPLDGHDYYFVRLGDTATLVYDLSTGQWMEWTSEDLNFWRINAAWNWIGMGTKTLSGGAKSKVVLGDDSAGLLWTLDPTVGVDDSARSDRDPVPFTRRVIGGVAQRMRDSTPVGAVYLTADLGTPQYTTATVTLRTSDDNGKTYQNQGTITVEPGNYDQEFVWRSVGQIRAPGRIFEITDNGAAVRIDGLDYR
jgi:hypothetical protein